MATTRTTWFGVVVEFSHNEITGITATLATGGASVATLTALLAAFGITGAAAVITGVIAALLGLGSAARVIAFQS
jgi:hypothetical protein